MFVYFGTINVDEVNVKAEQLRFRILRLNLH
jgi:hypothetical protein